MNFKRMILVGVVVAGLSVVESFAGESLDSLISVNYKNLDNAVRNLAGPSLDSLIPVNYKNLDNAVRNLIDMKYRNSDLDMHKKMKSSFFMSGKSESIWGSIIGLLRAGADPEMQDEKGKSVWDYIYEDEILKNDQKLIADIKQAQLPRAINQKDIQKTRKLLASGVDPNIQNAQTGRTVLHDVVGKRNIDNEDILLISLLLKFNADPLLEDFNGDSAWDLADFFAHQEVLDLFDLNLLKIKI